MSRLDLVIRILAIRRARAKIVTQTPRFVGAQTELLSCHANIVV